MSTENPDKDNFLRLGRSLRDDLLERRLRTAEWFVLVWLNVEANPHNGTVKVSYEGLAQDLQGEYTKNQITKIIGTLKAKGYIFFPKRQGKSGSFLVHLNNYPLSNGRFTSFKDADPSGNSVTVIQLGQGKRRMKSGKSEAEVLTYQQKFTARLTALTDDFFASTDTFGISTNNDSENENHKDSEKDNSLQRREEKLPGIRSESEIESERKRCGEIAGELGDPSPALVLSYCAKYGIEIVEEGLEQAMEARRKGRARNVAALFNSIVQELGERKLVDRRLLEEQL